MISVSNGSSRCSICSQHRWAIDNTYLFAGPSAALDLCEELGVSKSAFYRHIKSHMSLCQTTPPEDRRGLEWCRASSNLAAAVERYRVIESPEAVVDIAIRVGEDDVGKFVGLFIIHNGALFDDGVEKMCYDLGLIREEEEVIPGVNPTKSTSMKMHTEKVFTGRIHGRKS